MAVKISHWLLFSFVKNQRGNLRVGWTYPTYVGPAVVRNRFKRWSREFVRHLTENVKNTPADINILLRRKDAHFYRNVTHEVFNATLANAFRKFEDARA